MHPLYSIPNFVTSALIAGLGLFVFLRRPREPINRLFGLLTWSLSHWLFGYGLLYCTADPHKAVKIARLAYIGVVFIPTFFLHFVYEFLQLKRRVQLRFIYALTFVFLYMTQLPTFINSVYLYFWGFYPKAGPTYWLWIIYFYTAFSICDYEVIRAYFNLRHMPHMALRTKQIKYVLWANCVATISLMDYLPNYGWSVYPCAYVLVLGWLLLIAYAIVKFRLMDIRLAIRKTLIYSFVSAVLTAIYFLIVTLLTHLSSGVIGKSSWISVAAAGVVVTLIFLPIFRKVQALIDRFFFRFRIDREARLMELSSEIIQQEDTEHLTQSLCQTLDDSLHPKMLGLYLQTTGLGDFLEVSGRIPDSWSRVLRARNPWAEHFAKDSQPLVWDPFEGIPEGSPEIFAEMVRMEVQAVIPLVSRDDVLGFLFLGGKRSEESYTNEDLILLRIIANQATVAYERPKLLREVSGGFVHEVKMPLSKISLPAELTYLEIEQVLNGKGSAEELLPKIQRRMKYIMDQAFLAGHRVEALQQLSSRKQLVREPVQLAELLHRSSDSLEGLLKQGGVRFTMEIPRDLPAVLADAKQLEIVFVNLIRNAAEATMELSAKESRNVYVRGRTENGNVLIQVEDNGPGVNPEDSERIFQSHYTTKGLHGSGMGLFLCRQIVEACGGEIEVQNAEGGGAIFRISLAEAI